MQKRWEPLTAMVFDAIGAGGAIVMRDKNA